jgi:hypothetical protein
MYRALNMKELLTKNGTLKENTQVATWEDFLKKRR